MRKEMKETNTEAQQWHKGTRILDHRWQNAWLDLRWNPYILLFWQRAQRHNSKRHFILRLSLFTCNSMRCPQRWWDLLCNLCFSRGQGTEAQWHKGTNIWFGRWHNLCFSRGQGTEAQWHKGTNIWFDRWQNAWLDLLLWNAYLYLAKGTKA